MQSALAGVLLFVMIVLTILSGFLPELVDLVAWPIGLSAAIAALLLVRNVGPGPKIQVGLLLLIGLVLLGFAHSRGVDIVVVDVMTRNTGLLTMILSVGFLKLVVVPKGVAPEQLPVGRRAYFNTLFGVALFGSVINISAPVLMADRLTSQKKMDLMTASSMVRVFSCCASWSPFFAGMAVVLVTVPDVRLLLVMLVGLPLGILSVLFVYANAVRRHKQRLESFEGYPLKVSSLWIPALLAVTVIATYHLLPSLSILVVIAVSALMLMLFVLIVRTGVQDAVSEIRHYILKVLPGSVNELLLFLAAGVLAAGLTGLVDAGVIHAPLDSFNAATAAGLLAIMIFIAAMGVHPVIQISGLAPLVLAANPNPSLLASTFLFAWSLGTCASPLSGTNLIFQGRYGLPAWRIAVNNWPFVATMYVVAVGLLFVSEGIQS